MSCVRGVIALVVSVVLLAASPARADDRVGAGRKLFKDEGCPQCHGFGGKGDGYLLGMLKEPVKMHDWTDAATMRAFDDAYLFDITKQGGESLGKNKVMLKYAHKLDDEQIRTIVVFIRSLAAPPATPAS
jgi:mono/diheme cytochrome c family protein